MSDLSLKDEHSAAPQIITQRNQRHFRGREIRCAKCEKVSTFDELPHSCDLPNCSNTFYSGEDILLEDKHIWWDDNLLRNSKILVIGCGAIGNEVVKTLVLIGAKNYTLIDFDDVEESNRSRTVLFNSASMDAMDGKGPHMKVDVMAAGIHNLDCETVVTTIPKGIPDWRTTRHNEDVASGAKSGQLRPVLTKQEMMSLADSHDLAIIGTDGISPHAYFNTYCYSRIPQVRGSMNTAGSGSVVSVTIPFVTPCLQCHDIQSPLVTRMSDGSLDWSAWNNASGFNCKQMADESGAASFAHANSVVASAMASQAILLLHGYPSLERSKLTEWPMKIPPPSWNARIELPTYLPEKSKSTLIPTHLKEDGFSECPACLALFYEDDDFTWERFGYEDVEDTPRFDTKVDPFARKKPPLPVLKKDTSDLHSQNSKNQPLSSPIPSENNISVPAIGPKKLHPVGLTEMPADIPLGEEPPGQVTNRPPPPPPPKSKDASNEKPPPVTPLPDPIPITDEEIEEQTRQLKKMYENVDHDRIL